MVEEGISQGVLTRAARRRENRSARRIPYNPAKLRLALQDVPRHRWHGTSMTEDDVYAASGDGRDWFHVAHRLEAFRDTEELFESARLVRRDYTTKRYGWYAPRIIAIVGEYGVGKTTLGISEAYRWYILGHPVFHNTACLFGNRLATEEMYAVWENPPKGCVILIDEASSLLPGRGQANTNNVITFAEGLLNIRKASALMIAMTAQPNEMAPQIRHEIQEAWYPIEKKRIHHPGHRKPRGAYAEARNPANFLTVFEVEDDYPYRYMDSYEGTRKEAQEKLRSNRVVRVRQGDWIRNAFMLTNSFQYAELRQAKRADSGAVQDLVAHQYGEEDGFDLGPEWAPMVEHYILMKMGAVPKDKRGGIYTQVNQRMSQDRVFKRHVTAALAAYERSLTLEG